jgi:MFS family permease
LAEVGTVPKLERNVYVLGISSMIATFGAYTWTYFLPLYYATAFNTSPSAIGLIYTVWLLMIGLGAAPAGALADIHGRKIIVVLAGLISASGVFLLAFSGHSFLLAAIGFPITGIGTSFLSVSNIMVAESVDSKRRGSALGSFQALAYLLPSLSPLIGGLSLRDNLSYFFPLFIFGGSLVIVATILRALFTRETLSAENKAESVRDHSVHSYFERITKVFRNRVLLTLILVYSLYNLLIDQNTYIVPLYGKNQLALDPLTLAYLFTAITLISAIARFPFGKLSDRIGRRSTIIVSWIGESSSIFIFVFAPRSDLPVALLGICVWTIFGVMDGPAVNAWLADATDARNRGLSMGSFYSAAFLVAVPFFSVAGYLYEVNSKLPFYANSLLGICALIILMTLTGSKKSEPD